MKNIRTFDQAYINGRFVVPHGKRLVDLVNPTNNEVNVIAGRCYLALNYFKRVVGTYPGLTDLCVTPGKILTAPGGATVEMIVTYKLNGKDQKVERVGGSAIPVRLNAGMGADGAIGKATRKVLKAVYEKLTGSQAFNDGDVDDATDMIVSARVVPDSEVEAKPEAPKPTKTQTVADQIKKNKVQSATETDKMVNVPPKTPQEKTEEPQPQIQDDGPLPWENQVDADDLEPAETEQQPAAEAAVDELAQTIQTQANAKAETKAAPLATTTETPEKKKPKGGWVKNEATGEMERVGSTPQKKVEGAPPQSEKKPAPKQEIVVEAAQLGEPETTQDIVMTKVTQVRDQPGGTVLFYKAITKESTDIWAIDNEALAMQVQKEWIPKGTNGEVATIKYRATKIGAYDVNLIESVE